jgi:hypothetical protein
VAGRKQGRTDEKEVTLFKSVGLAIVDIVVANYSGIFKSPVSSIAASVDSTTILFATIIDSVGNSCI